LDTPASIEEAVSETVIRRLETALGDRGLLLSADELTAAESGAAQQGSRLLGVVIDRCYPEHRHAGATFEFDSDRAAARLAAALEFGAVTARVLARGELGGSVELLCAIFNLGIGLVDGICDDDAETGGAVLELVQRQDLVQASDFPRPRGWLRDTLPATLAEDHTVAFTVDIIEVFFATLHAVYPDDAWLHLRRRVGAQLCAALEAERESVAGAAGRAGRERLIECSRLTSVLPFQIIEALAFGGHPGTEPTPGTLLGEAMWWIDDLVDLGQDARSGALNGVLLTATEGGGIAALEQLLDSTEVADAAGRAAERLLAGLQLSGGGPAAAHAQPSSRVFLYFIQRYAGIAPRPS
jgi:hypothetical protein